MKIHAKLANEKIRFFWRQQPRSLHTTMNLLCRRFRINVMVFGKSNP